MAILELKSQFSKTPSTTGLHCHSGIFVHSVHQCLFRVGSSYLGRSSFRQVPPLESSGGIPIGLAHQFLGSLRLQWHKDHDGSLATVFGGTFVDLRPAIMTPAFFLICAPWSPVLNTLLFCRYLATQHCPLSQDPLL